MIAVDDLHKSYGGHPVLRGVTFACRPGRVTGFLGPNGAGKSTTLRVLCGLATADRGTALVDGLPYADHEQAGTQVGVMLDTSALHPGRTGRESVRLVAMMTRQSRSRADETLEMVGLADAAGRRVGQYSLGMRQRLGVAVALVARPRTLILDEPVNGLDPEGIHWIRTLIRGFAADGGTVLVSSHLLNEVAATVDDVVIIGAGRVVRESALADLAGVDEGTVVETLDPDRLAAALVARGLAYEAAGAGVRVQAPPAVLGQLLLDERIVATALVPSRRSSIEDVFLQVTADASGPGADPMMPSRAAAARQEVAV
jgi:ABC-2 type transport system ATP-binding protein